jgi:hypothetical protein
LRIVVALDDVNGKMTLMFMKRLIPAFLLISASLTAQATLIDFTATLLGTSEVPVNASPGTGFVTATLDTSTDSLTLAGSFSGLVAGSTASHIHFAGAGTNGPVIIPLTITTLGNTSGTLSLSGTVLSATQESELLGGFLYVNVHSTTFPGGEIRGQLAAVPDAASTSLLVLLGLAGVVLVRRMLPVPARARLRVPRDER